VNHVAAADGRTFFVDEGSLTLVALDLATGNELWQSRNLPEILGGGEAARRDFAISWRDPMRVAAGICLLRSGSTFLAFAQNDGRFLWQARGNQSTWIVNGLVWNTQFGAGSMTGLDPFTGEPVKTVPAAAMRVMGHHVRCYPGRATDRFMLGNERGVEFIDFETGQVTLNNWVRVTCYQGVMPANGLLYAPPHSCRCYAETMIRGFFALAPDRSPTGELSRAPAAGPRLVRGPAYGDVRGIENGTAEGEDWPTYRHDSARSGAASTRLPAELAELWRVDLGNPVAAPTIASGRLFVAEPEAHAVRALDAGSGADVWRFLVGARVDSPPTVYGDIAIFGASDGWVHCVRAADGELVWRFRAAPRERFVGAMGRLESAWPVHGSVLVHDGIAYCAAGRSSFLDGGIYVYGLDPLTGRVLHDHRLDGPWPGPEVGTSEETPNPGYVVPGALSDILVSDGDRVYLRQLAFDPSLREKVDLLPHFYPAPELTREEEGGDHKYWDNLLGAPRHATRHLPDYWPRSYFNNWPGRRLYATTGLLDNSWHKRSYWSYGQIVGQYLVFSGGRGYAVKAYSTATREGGVDAGEGYLLYAGRTGEPQGDRELYALDVRQADWQNRLPLRVRGMVLAGERLYATGIPDSEDPDKALAALEGRLGGLLYVLSAASGEKVGELELDFVPTFDGMAAADGRLYITTDEGEVVCYGSGT
jgi:outer membrane protein assembly factor BamB